MNFWEKIDNSSKTKNYSNNNNFNINEFFKFYTQNKNKNPNDMLNQLIQSGNYSQEEIENATNKAKGVAQMLQNMGFFK